MKAGRDENYKAQRLFIFLSFAMIFITGIGAAGSVYWIILDSFLGYEIPFDLVTALLFIIIFLGYLIGLFGILIPKPPFHFAILIASTINLIVSLIIISVGNSYGLFHGVISAIILYLGLRFPLQFGEGEVTFNLNK